MRRFVIVLSVFVVFAGMLIYARGNAVTAQDAMTSHPVVGAWRFETDIGGEFTLVSFGIFHADGTYIEEAYAGGPMNIGAWEPTGERAVDLTLFNQEVIDDQLLRGEGRLAVAVDETGNAMTWTGTFVGLREDGSVDMAVETPGRGARLQVLPVEPLGTPVIPWETPAAGTPAP